MDRRETFYENLKNVLGPEKSKFIRTPEEMEKIKEFLSGSCEKPTMEQRNWINRYCLKEVVGDLKVYYKFNEKQMLSWEELFDVIDKAHRNTVHGGRDILMKECKPYNGIPRVAFEEYLKLCQECEMKKSKVRKGLVVKPILSKEMNSRCQVDLVDMQAQPFEDYNHIMVYQDHLTKFVILKALKNKTARAVAKKLVKIFGIFGSPRILHSDNGKEFKNQVIRELLKIWADCKMVTGKPRHSQSQGSVERSNLDIENMLAAWCSENNTNDWVSALPMITAAKNRRFHSGIKRSPYEAMFGVPMKMGISDDGIPNDKLKTIETEEQLEEIFNLKATDENNNSVEINDEDANSTINEENTVDPLSVKVDESGYETLLEKPDETDFGEIVKRIREQREGAKDNLEKQAEKMLKASKQRYQSVSPGRSVRIPVPSVDRAKVDHRNVLAVVLNEEDGLYQLGTSDGILPQRFVRSQFEPTASNFLMSEQVPSTSTSLRSSASTSSVFGGQGFFHCNCTIKCENNRCKCRKNGRFCNSRCHNSLTCSNK